MPLLCEAERADWTKAARYHLDPLRVLPEPCLPAESRCPGHIPAHDEMGGGGKDGHVGADLDEDDLCEGWSTPGIVVSSSTWAANGANVASIRSSRAAISVSWASTWSSVRFSRNPWCLRNRPVRALRRSGILVRSRALGQLGQRGAVALSGDQFSHHGPAGGAHHIGGVGRWIDPGVLEHLVDSVDLRGLLVDQCFAVPGQVT